MHSFSILFWGLIKADGSRMLVKYPSKLNSARYQAVLKEGFFDKYGNESIFIMDVPKPKNQFRPKPKICFLNLPIPKPKTYTKNRYRN